MLSLMGRAVADHLESQRQQTPCSHLKLKTGLLQKALWCTVFGFQFLVKRVFPAVNCLLKTENLKFAKLQLKLKTGAKRQASLPPTINYQPRTATNEHGSFSLENHVVRVWSESIGSAN